MNSSPNAFRNIHPEETMSFANLVSTDRRGRGREYLLPPDYTQLFANAILTGNDQDFQVLFEETPSAMNYLVRVFPQVPPVALIRLLTQNGEIIRDLFQYSNLLPLHEVGSMSPEEISHYLLTVEEVLGRVPEDFLQSTWNSWLKSFREYGWMLSSSPALDLIQLFHDLARKYSSN